MSKARQRLLCLGTTRYAEVFLDTHQANSSFEFTGFLENRDHSKCASSLSGLPVLWSDDAHHLASAHWITCALATTHRKRWVEELNATGFRSATLVHET
ncbi:MAG: hypothetical protein O7I42_08115, partial [Alphaproteobacteria bacterium]|nr:hypothetical protein [Alphaproteobacteria bacterium]